MTRERPRVVVDASAILAWVLNEPGANVIDRLLAVAALPAPNLTEVLYRARERGHRMAMADLARSITEMGVRIEPFTAADGQRAAELIEQSRATGDTSSLSLADATCLAVAERLEVPVTGGDQHWELLDLRTPYRPFR